MNKITNVSLELLDNGTIEITVTKEFAPENGGGFQEFRETCDNDSFHYALGQAKQMITVTAGRRTDGKKY